MARVRKTDLDLFVDRYISLSAEDRTLAMAMIRGVDRVLVREPKPAANHQTEEMFEEAGERAAEGL